MSRANFVQVQLAQAATDTQNTLVVKAPVGGFKLPPVGGGRLVLTDSPGRPEAFEVISYTGVTGSDPYTLTGVVRGLEGTVGLRWGVDTYVLQALTVGELDEIIAGREPAIAAGSTAQYRRGDKTWRDFATDVRAAVLTGLSTASAAAIAATDSVLSALGKLQAQITGLATSKLDATANAVSASKLQTARTIGGVAFDGTADINLPGVNAAGNQDTTGNAASAAKLQTARTINGVAFDGTSNIVAAFGWGHTAGSLSAVGDVNTNLAPGLYYYNSGASSSGAPEDYGSLLVTSMHGPADGYSGWASQMFFSTSGRVFTRISTAANPTTAAHWAPWRDFFDAANLSRGIVPDARLSGTYTGVNITGNAATATKLQTARTIALTGDVAGSANFDGSANVSINAQVADDSHTHSLGNLGLGNAATATVQTSAYDTTAGALMSVGAFGLGSAALSISPNLNNELRSSFLRVEPSTLNRPPEVNYGHAVVCAISAEAAQSVIDIVTGDLWTRKLQAGFGWSNWRKHFHTGNILGTVSQSGGTPTGAIIERGSNSNGEYVRYADGTQICTVEITLSDINQPAGSIYRSSNDLVWSFPAAFTSTPSVAGTSVALTGAWIAAGESSNNATTAYIRGIWHTSITANISVRAIAIGRWY